MEVGHYKERASRGRVIKVWGDGIRILGTVAITIFLALLSV